MPIKISIIEKQSGAAFKKLKPALAKRADICCSRIYFTGEEAVWDIPFKQPDIALVDTDLSPMSSIECVTRLKSRFPELLLLVLDSEDDGECALELLCAGADGILSKELSPAALLQSIELAKAGEVLLTPAVTRDLIRHICRGDFRPGTGELAESFTPRELKIIEVWAQGHDRERIGSQLNIDPEIIKLDQYRILKKLHANTRIQALIKFFKTETPDRTTDLLRPSFFSR